MIKVVNPFNKKEEAIYTAANACSCACTAYGGQTDDQTHAGLLSRKADSSTRYCYCAHGDTNKTYNKNGWY